MHGAWNFVHSTMYNEVQLGIDVLGTSMTSRILCYAFVPWLSVNSIFGAYPTYLGSLRGY